MKILVADDDPKLNKLICNALTDVDFIPDSALSAAEAQKKIGTRNYGLAIIDWMFEGEKIDGKDLIQQIVKSENFPILMLTGKRSLADRMAGLDAGADDYLIKPFYLPELIARVKALLRRNRKNAADQKIIAGPIALDPESFDVIIGSDKMDLRKKEFSLLHALVKKKGKVISRVALGQIIWGEEGVLVSNSIDVHVKSLRDKLGKYGKMIETVRGIGYRFNEKKIPYSF